MQNIYIHIGFGINTKYINAVVIVQLSEGITSKNFLYLFIEGYILK